MENWPLLVGMLWSGGILMLCGSMCLVSDRRKKRLAGVVLLLVGFLLLAPLWLNWASSILGR